ncbi:MAG: helix-turn-helix transcriptional regulator [Clostridia bacterium]|nr:helix-turn-helix transcriptional regulator [Clostridia bacterium]
MTENKNIDLYMNIIPYRESETINVDSGRSALHEEIEIKCFYEGTSVLIVGENKVEVGAGDIVVMNPYEFHATIDKGTEQNRGKYHLFMISPDIFSNNGVDGLNLRSLLLEDGITFKTLFQNDKRMFKILSRTVTEYQERKTAYNTAIIGLMMEFFAILMRKGIADTYAGTTKNNNLRSYRLIEPAIRRIRDNFKQEITVDELSELCHVSKPYFCRAFKRLTGKTVMEYLREYRLQISDVKLMNSDKSIACIAEECGFESLSYFCRCYKSHFGFTPGERRRIQISTENIPVN